MTRTIITIGPSARKALERYEAAQGALNEMPLPALTESWDAFHEARKPLVQERDEAARDLAAFVALAMRLALAEQETDRDAMVRAIDDAFAGIGEL